MATAVFIIRAGRGTRRDVACAVKECDRTVIEDDAGHRDTRLHDRLGGHHDR
jgi:hypothetical protein